MRFSACAVDVREAARRDAECILNDLATNARNKVQRLAESPALCDLMDHTHAARVDSAGAQLPDATLDVDTPLAQALAVRLTNVPSEPCHEVVVSSLDHEIKSITGYSPRKCYCYRRDRLRSNSRVAVGGVCLQVTGRLGDTFEPRVPGKLVLYKAEWMTPWTALLCIIGAMNTMLMIIFLVLTPWTPGLAVNSPAFFFLVANVVTETIAIGIGWSLKHRWQMGWKQYLVRSDPFHALLTADGDDVVKVAWILALEAVGGAASVVGIAFTSGVPLEVLSSVAIPVATACLAKSFSKSSGFKTSLILGAMTFYLMEFLYEIVVIYVLDDSILGWVVIASCILESLSLIWIITTVLYAIHYVSAHPANWSVLKARAPARIRDGTLLALKFPDIPSKGLMGTAALGSALLPGNFIPLGGLVIKEGSTSYVGWSPNEKPIFGGWLSLSECKENGPFVDKDTFQGTHHWLGHVVIACGQAIPILG